MDTWDRPATRRATRPLAAALAIVISLVVGWLAVGTSSPLSRAVDSSTAVDSTASDELDISRGRARDDVPALPAVGAESWVPPRSASWRVLPPAPIGPRVGHTVTEVGGTTLVWGGYQHGRALRNGAVFDASAGEWEIIDDAPVAERGHVPIGAGRILLLLHEQTPMAYDLDAKAWRQLPAPPLLDGMLLSDVTAWTGRIAVVVTGTAGGDLGPLLAFDLVRESWSALPAPPVDVTDDHALVWNGRDLLLFGRATDSRDFAHRLTFSTSNVRPEEGQDWEALPPPPLDDRVARTASARAIASGSVRADEPVYVWVGPRPGGPRSVTFLEWQGSSVAEGGDGGWRMLSSPPVAASVPSLAWTGEEMLAISASGAVAYDPDVDAFRRLPAAEIPPRQQREAAWTGEYLIWWGGATGDGAAWRPARVSDVLDVTSAPGRLTRTMRDRVP